MARVRKTFVEFEGRKLERFIIEDDGEKPLEPWGEGAKLGVVGRPTPRQDGLEKATGRARYTADVHLPGMLFGKVLRSPHPHARVASVDPAEALAQPGVRCVLTPFDEAAHAVKWHEDESRLLDRVVRYVGDEVALVAAETEEQAEDALLVLERSVVYEPLPFVVDLEAAARPDAPLVHPGGNLFGGAPRVRTRGDLAKGLAAAEATVDLTVRTPCAIHNALEAHGAVAAWEGDRLVVYESTQHVYGARDEIAGALGLPLHKVRVVMEHMGGGFGSKQASGKHAVLAALAARRTGRPCRVFLDRREESLAGQNRAETLLRVKLGATRDGRLTAIYLHGLVNLGAYAAWVSPVHGPILEMYPCENVRTEVAGVRTNLGPFGAFRGPGYVQGTIALEQAMDALARKLGIDAVEMRLRNLDAEDEEARKGRTGGDPAECLRRAARGIGWGEGRGAGGGAGAGTGRGAGAGGGGGGEGGNGVESGGGGGGRRTRRGTGCACVVWGGGGGPPAYAVVRVQKDGTAIVTTGSQDIGTGTRTSMALIAAEELGLEVGAVRVEMGDTGVGAYAPVSAGSMTLASVGPAVRAAARDAADQGRALAEAMGDARMPLKDAIAKIQDSGFTLVGRGSRGANPETKEIKTYAAHAAEVEVDLDTGAVRVVRVVAVHDSGRVVSPLAAAGQVEGGVIQGIGLALSEERVVDAASGRPLNADLERYAVPTALDVPLAVEAGFLDVPDVEANPLGAKGLGEPPLIGAPAAIANAVSDALGRPVRELPLTRERVLALVAGVGPGDGEARRS